MRGPPCPCLADNLCVWISMWKILQQHHLLSRSNRAGSRTAGQATIQGDPSVVSRGRCIYTSTLPLVVMSIDPYLENWIYGHVPLHTYLCIMVRYKKHSRLEVKADPEIRIQGDPDGRTTPQRNRKPKASKRAASRLR